MCVCVCVCVRVRVCVRVCVCAGARTRSLVLKEMESDMFSAVVPQKPEIRPHMIYTAMDPHRFSELAPKTEN